MLPRKMRLTEELVALVPPHDGKSGGLAGRGDLPSDADYAGAVADLLAGAPASGDVWIFAYGSLIWEPGFDFVEERPGTISGWRRSFCVGWVRIYRGTPERPGVMLALDRGGSCRGVVYRLAPETMEQNLTAIVRREHPVRWKSLHMRWVNARTDAGTVRALVVVMDRSHPAYLPDLTEDVVVEALATAAGERGSMAEYLRSTVVHLEERGIHDRYLWRLQERVAERLERGAQQR
ncbi:gamma-glutamylcyclotransferase [Tropicimonas sp. IMCC34043]|uniref:gamma-glutamylcyclotransferase n=1 Tax=Tropicimonas sp. IMCC34043 TaxID=2248760 RepID=UPI0013002EC8|nr:gamma-glutamylcyclotransferase [Tropicimonas sp. IMCC34043]